MKAILWIILILSLLSALWASGFGMNAMGSEAEAYGTHFLLALIGAAICAGFLDRPSEKLNPSSPQKKDSTD
jgi:hypothetical protein